jgi:hypothetical protein
MLAWAISVFVLTSMHVEAKPLKVGKNGELDVTLTKTTPPKITVTYKDTKNPNLDYKGTPTEIEIKYEEPNNGTASWGGYVTVYCPGDDPNKKADSKPRLLIKNGNPIEITEEDQANLKKYLQEVFGKPTFFKPPSKTP